MISQKSFLATRAIDSPISYGQYFETHPFYTTIDNISYYHISIWLIYTSHISRNVALKISNYQHDSMNINICKMNVFINIKYLGVERIAA